MSRRKIRYDFDVFLRSENDGRAFANNWMIPRNQNAIMFVGNDFIWASSGKQLSDMRRSNLDHSTGS
jgi:hypothetical protein